jgi:hypothetical protein
MIKPKTSTLPPPRKRKQPSLFSPPSRQEEKEITRALQLSLRKIPSDPGISEDESEPEDGDFGQEVEANLSDDDEAEAEEYETKWSTEIQAIEVTPFNQPSGPTKDLPSRQGVKNFFELMFTKKVWNHICSQTNIYAKQRMLLHPDPKWKSLTVGELKAWVGCLESEK